MNEKMRSSSHPSEITADPKVFSQNVEFFRKYEGVSIRQLAKKAGVAVNTLVRIQRGCACSLKTQDKIASALNAKLGTLWSPEILAVPQYHHFNEENTRWYFTPNENENTWPLSDGIHRDPENIQ